MNLTGCEIHFVLFGLDGRVTRVEPYTLNGKSTYPPDCVIFDARARPFRRLDVKGKALW